MGFYFFLLATGSDSLQILNKLLYSLLYFFDLQNWVFFFTTDEMVKIDIPYVLTEMMASSWVSEVMKGEY